MSFGELDDDEQAVTVVIDSDSDAYSQIHEIPGVKKVYPA